MAKFSPDEYRHESNAVSLLNYHFVFIPKRRKKVLVGAIAPEVTANYLRVGYRK
jgi:putative transposase